MSSPLSKPDQRVAPFLPARARLWIGSLDNPTLEVQAQYNPKELQIDKQVPWQSHKDRDNRPADKRIDRTPSEQADLEFNGAPSRSMSLELMFDGYEDGASVEPDILKLDEMSSVIEPELWDPDLRRPHHCVVAWGDAQNGMRPFRCVIESLAVKYTMWDRDGRPVRATCTLKLKEAEHMGRKQSEETTQYRERVSAAYWKRDQEMREETHRTSQQAIIEAQQRAAALRK